MAVELPEDLSEGDPEVISLRARIGEALRKARRNTGLTQVQLSQRTGLSQTLISAIERGSQSPTLTSLVLLTRAIGYSLNITISPPCG